MLQPQQRRERPVHDEYRHRRVPCACDAMAAVVVDMPSTADAMAVRPRWLNSDVDSDDDVE